MKRKPNKPRPEAQTHTEPGNGAAEPEGSAFGAGSEQEPGAAGTSGQSVPKSKFRQKSQQEQAAASKLRMEKRGEKREAAREKLAKQKPPKQKGPIRKAAGAAGWGVHGFVHGKLYEVEQENVGTEGAHRSELAGEVVLRHGSRFVKRKVREHPARAASRAEARYQKAAADYHFHTAAQEHPELSKNYFTRYWQKQRLRRQYQKRAKVAAKQSAKAAGKTAAATEKLTARAAGFVKRHPVGCLLALACVLVIVLLQSCSSSLVSIGNAGAGALGRLVRRRNRHARPAPSGGGSARRAARLPPDGKERRRNFAAQRLLLDPGDRRERRRPPRGRQWQRERHLPSRFAGARSVAECGAELRRRKGLRRPQRNRPQAGRLRCADGARPFRQLAGRDRPQPGLRGEAAFLTTWIPPTPPGCIVYIPAFSPGPAFICRTFFRFAPTGQLRNLHTARLSIFYIKKSIFIVDF